MATVQQARKKTQGIGLVGVIRFNPDNIIAKRAPVNGSDFAEISTSWIDTTNQVAYVCVGNGIWTTAPAAGAGVFTDVLVSPGDVTVDTGDVIIDLGDLTVGGNAAVTGNLSVTGTTTVPALTLTAGGIKVLSGAGSPNAVVVAPIGSLYLRTDPVDAASRAYVNTDGATGWTNLVAAA